MIMTRGRGQSEADAVLYGCLRLPDHRPVVKMISREQVLALLHQVIFIDNPRNFSEEFKLFSEAYLSELHTAAGLPDYTGTLMDAVDTDPKLIELTAALADLEEEGLIECVEIVERDAPNGSSISHTASLPGLRNDRSVSLNTMKRALPLPVLPLAMISVELVFDAACPVSDRS